MCRKNTSRFLGSNRILE
uniref:Uncharacterized protein n=1 Tax=Arundo donax TaxID=35708 RepID=A0A0A9BI91_ARUDO